MSNIDSNTLADAIRNFVRQQNGSVSFVELSRQLPGIDGDFGLFPDGDGKRAKQARQASKKDRHQQQDGDDGESEHSGPSQIRASHAQRDKAQREAS